MKNGKPKLFSDHATQTRNRVMHPFPHLLPSRVNPRSEAMLSGVSYLWIKAPKGSAGCGSTSRKEIRYLVSIPSKGCTTGSSRMGGTFELIFLRHKFHKRTAVLVYAADRLDIPRQ